MNFWFEKARGVKKLRGKVFKFLPPVLDITS